jgi:hypothetical protein
VHAGRIKKEGPGNIGEVLKMEMVWVWLTSLFLFKLSVEFVSGLARADGLSFSRFPPTFQRVDFSATAERVRVA